MALNGMTGFGRAEGAVPGWTWVWETRSVNGRGLDQRFRWPPGLDALEPKAREAIKARFTRGSLQINLQMRREDVAIDVAVDMKAAQALIDAGKPLIEAGQAVPPHWDGILAVRGVVGSAREDDDAEAVAERNAALLASLNTALDALVAARRGEGEALNSMLAAMIDKIEALTNAARETAGASPDQIKARLGKQIAALIDGGMDEERLAQEAALMAVKADVREELDRLDAHVASARELLAAGSPAGRKLDFLTQEFNREANTLCSKAADLALTQIGLELKAVIDQMREQCQNVE